MREVNMILMTLYTTSKKLEMLNKLFMYNYTQQNLDN